MIGSHKSSRTAIANAVDKIEAAQRLLAEGVRELAAALALDEMPASGALTRFEAGPKIG
jgi:hypothetical protein